MTQNLGSTFAASPISKNTDMLKDGHDAADDLEQQPPLATIWICSRAVASIVSLKVDADEPVLGSLTDDDSRKPGGVRKHERNRDFRLTD